MDNPRLHKLNGAGIALVTPFKPDLKVDFSALGNVIDYVLKSGVDFLVSLGTTGEANTLSIDECVNILQFTTERTAGKVPVIAGFFGDNNTARLAEKLRTLPLQELADCIMVSSPAYTKPSQEGIFQHYMAVANASPLPIVIYNVPGRTSSNIQAETTIRLASASTRFIAIKEASGDIGQAMKILKEKPDHFSLWSGDDIMTLPLIACGASGAVSVVANAFPQVFSSMVQAALRNDFVEARHFHNLLLDIYPLLFAEGSPSGIKAAMEILDLCPNRVRLPLVAASETLQDKLRNYIQSVLPLLPVPPIIP
jgi:4-hydroxy-tetrahydrodipicolinate synthase